MTNVKNTASTAALVATAPSVMRPDEALANLKAVVIESAKAIEEADKAVQKAKGCVNAALETWGDAVAAIAPTIYWMNNKLPGFEQSFYEHHRSRLKTALLDTKRYVEGGVLDTTIARAMAIQAQKLCDRVQDKTLKVNDELFVKLETAAKQAPANVAKANRARRESVKSNLPPKAKPATPKAKIKAKLKDLIAYAAKHKLTDVAAKLKAIKV